MADEASVSTQVNAPASKVYDLVSDLTRMGEWSPECQRVEWKGGATKPAVGARFKGHNKRGKRRWSTNCTIVSLKPDEELAFEVTASPLNLPVARWSYRVEPVPDNPGACTLTETWTDRRTGIVVTLGNLMTGVKDRKGHNTDGMRETLARIKAAAER